MRVTMPISTAGFGWGAFSLVIGIAAAACGDGDTPCEGPSCGDSAAGGLPEAGGIGALDVGSGMSVRDAQGDGAQPDGLVPIDGGGNPDTNRCTPTRDGCCDGTLWEREWDPDCRRYAVVLDTMAIEAATPALDTQRGFLHLVFRRAVPVTTVYQRRHLDDGSLSYEHTLGDGPPRCPIVLDDGQVLVLTQTQVLRIDADAQSARIVADLPNEPVACPAWVSDTLVVPVITGAVAIDVATGATKWTWIAPEGEDLSAPAAGSAQDKGVVVASSSGVLWWLDLATGTAVESKPGTLSLSVGNPVPTGDPQTWAVVGLGIKAEPWIARWQWQGAKWSEPLDESLVGQPALGRENTIAEDGTLVVSKAGGGWVEIDPALLTLKGNPAGVLHVTTEPTLLAGGDWLVGTTQGMEVFFRAGDTMTSRWRYNINEGVVHAPLGLPGGDVLLLGPTALFRIVAQQAALAATPWPRARGGWYNRGVAPSPSRLD